MADIAPTYSEVEEPFQRTHDDDGLPNRHHGAPVSERSWTRPTKPSSPTMILRQFDHIASPIQIDRVGCGSDGSSGGPPHAEPTRAGRLPSPRNAGGAENGGSGPVPAGRGAGADRRRGVARMTTSGVEA